MPSGPARIRAIAPSTARSRVLSASTSRSSAFFGLSNSCTPRLMPSPSTTLHQSQKRKRSRTPGGSTSGTIMPIAAGSPMAVPKDGSTRIRLRNNPPPTNAGTRQTRSQVTSSATM